MNKTGAKNGSEIPLKERIAVDTLGLMALCSCGKSTALEIGKSAGALLKIGKRTLWNVEKVLKYLETLREAEK